MKVSRLLLIVVALAAAISVARAKVPPLLEVPDYLADNARQDLTSQREVLEKRIAALRKWADDFNTRCGGRTLQEDDPTAKDCLAEKAKLDMAGQDYTRDALAFDDEVLRATVVGSIGEARGEFYIITPDGRKIEGVVGKSVSKGSSIVTSASARVQLRLLDETVFTMGANANVEIDDFIYDPNSTVGKFAAQVLHGVFRLVTGKIARTHPENMKVGLAVGSIGSRGTDFEVSVEPDGNGYVKLFSGKLEITKTKDSGKFNLDAGQMVKFDADGTWHRPVSLDTTRPSI